MEKCCLEGMCGFKFRETVDFPSINPEFFSESAQRTDPKTNGCQTAARGKLSGEKWRKEYIREKAQDMGRQRSFKALSNAGRGISFRRK